MKAKQIIAETLMRIEGDPDKHLFEGYAETILSDLQCNGVRLIEPITAHVYDGEHVWPRRKPESRPAIEME